MRSIHRLPDVGERGWLWSFGVRAGIIYVACMPFWTYPLGWGTPFRAALQKGTFWLHQHVFGAVGFDLSRFANADVASKLELGLAGAMLWLMLDRRRRREAELYEVLCVAARYALGAVVICFGLVKVFPIQMGPPSASQLIQPLAEPDSMWPGWGLMAKTVGASALYQMYTGWLEVVSGGLLFFRRTAVLGTLLVSLDLVAIIAMTSDTADFMRPVNFNWIAGAQVPAALFLIATVWRPTVDFFVLGRPTTPPPRPPWRWFTPFEAGLRIAFVAALLFCLAQTAATWHDRQHHSPLEGVYEVRGFTRNGEPRLDGKEAARRWRAVAIDCSGIVAPGFVARTIDDTALEFAIALPKGDRSSRRDCAEAIARPQGSLSLRPRHEPGPGESASQSVLRYSLHMPDRLELEGTLMGERITTELRRMEKERFALLRESQSGDRVITPSVLAFLALAAALAWIATIGEGRLHPAPREIMSVAARYVLAAAFVHDGVMKFLGVEPAPPSPVDWIRPLGEFTKCEIARLWLAYPPAHAFLVGGGETLAGLMLLVRRTAPLGAVIGVIGMINLMMVGTAYCGAAPGMQAMALVALAGSLVVADQHRLKDFLLLGRPTAPAPLVPPWPATRAGLRAGIALQALFVAWLVFADGYPAIRRWSDSGRLSPMRGVYRVETFTRDGRVVPLAHEWPERWRVVAIGNLAETIVARTVDGTSLALDSRTLTYTQPDPDRLVIEGRLAEGAIAAQLVRVDNESFSFYRWLIRH